MAIITLIIGIVLFIVGVAGQTMSRTKKPAAHPGDRRGFNIILTVGSIVIGAWLLIISTVQLLHAHHSNL